jgi:hypothetical protein
MPSTLTYPGVYVEEVPSGVRTIVGVATSITAFVGRTARGPTNDPAVLTSYGDYERTFGGLHADSPVNFAVRDSYLNGGSQAVVVRLFRPTLTAAERAVAVAAADAVNAAVMAVAAGKPPADYATAGRNAAKVITADPTKSGAEKGAAEAVAAAAETASLVAQPPATDVTVKAAAVNAVRAKAEFAAGSKTAPALLPFVAANEGAWGANIRVAVEADRSEQALASPKPEELFNLTVRVDEPGGAVETIRHLSLNKDSPRRVDRVLGGDGESSLVNWNGGWPPNQVNEFDVALSKPALVSLHDATDAYGQAAPANAVDLADKQAAVEDSQMLDAVTRAELTVRQAGRKLEKLIDEGKPDTDPLVIAAKKDLADAAAVNRGKKIADRRGGRWFARDEGRSVPARRGGRQEGSFRPR